jgi:hypothetical protein
MALLSLEQTTLSTLACWSFHLEVFERGRHLQSRAHIRQPSNSLKREFPLGKQAALCILSERSEREHSGQLDTDLIPMSSFALSPSPTAVAMKSGSSFGVTITFDSKSERGRFNDRVELIFEDAKLRQRFCITRSIKATVGVSTDYEAIRAVAPYVRPKRARYEPMREIVPGVAPEPLAKFKWAVKLGTYDVPKDLAKTLSGKASKELAETVREVFMPGELSETTYGRFFGVLLWIEEERAKSVFWNVCVYALD